MNKISIPVLKAWNKIFDLIKCINENPYNRIGFENSIMALFPGKSEKSVFRGMAIPTLRNLGLIVGYGDVIRISANGALIYFADQYSHNEGLRILRAILYEYDLQIGICETIGITRISKTKNLVSYFIGVINFDQSKILLTGDKKEKASKERIIDWINLLIFSGLLYNTENGLIIDEENLKLAQTDTDYLQSEKENIFKKIFFHCYNRIVSNQGNINTVEIELLRKEVALKAYKEKHIVITEKQFDEYLQRLPKSATNYSITFGRSMGADEKLFYYQGQFFQTIFIRFYS